MKLSHYFIRFLFSCLFFILVSCSIIEEATYDHANPQITLRLPALEKEKVCLAFDLALENKNSSPQLLCEKISLKSNGKKSYLCYDASSTGEAICVGMNGLLCRGLSHMGQGLCQILDGQFCSVSPNVAQGLCNALGSPYCAVLKAEDDEKWIGHFKKYCKKES